MLYLDDPVELFFMQVQGSGRVRFADGTAVRLGFAAKNGHPYTSIGKRLVEMGEGKPADLTMDGVKAWLRADPERGLGAAARSQSLVTPADLRPTLLEWWSLDRDDPAGFDRSLLPIVRDEAEAIHDRLMAASPGEEAAIRTPAWYMRLGERPKLYVKPDDRWEVNDVADRCPEVVEELQAAADDFIARLDAGRLDELTPLSDVLQTGLG